MDRPNTTKVNWCLNFILLQKKGILVMIFKVHAVAQKFKRLPFLKVPIWHFENYSCELMLTIILSNYLLSKQYESAI